MKYKPKISYEELEQSTFICAHDLKEPLRLVSNFIQLLQKHNSASFDDASLNYIDHILKCIDRMKLIITNILTYSQLPEENCVYREVDLNELINSIKGDYSSILKEINGSIETDCLPVIKAQPTQMYQLFLNLISNAIKFRGQTPLLINLNSGLVDQT